MLCPDWMMPRAAECFHAATSHKDCLYIKLVPWLASRHMEKHTNGSADAQVLASVAAEGRLAVVTKSKKRRQSLHLYTLQVCAVFNQFRVWQAAPGPCVTSGGPLASKKCM